jgi:hypothetical protein
MIRMSLAFSFLLACFTVTSALPQRAVMDFDGDNKSDYAVVRLVGSTYNWYLQQSTAGFRGQPWGNMGDTFVPADYDGDMKWDIAIWRAGTFYILQSSDGALRVVPFGQNGDNPLITQDFDGDGKADPAVTRLVGGNRIWYIQRSLLGFTSVQFGQVNDEGARGDFDGDGKADVAVYRISLGTPANTYFVLRSSDGVVQAQTFGNSNFDSVFPADFDSDGKTDYAVWRGTTGTWYWLNSSDGSFHAFVFGNGNDVPVPGDYDGDSKTDQAVWRSGAAANFYVNRSTLGFVALPFGTTGDSAPAFTLQAH